MARIPYPETEHLPHELRDLLRQANLNIFLMWAHSVNTVGIVAQLGAAQFAKLELPRSIRGLVTLLGGRANSANYEWVQHVAPSKAAGVTDEQRAALERHELTDAYFNPQELAALQLAAAVQAGPQVPDAIFDSARNHLSDRQLVELVGLVGYYWMLGRVATVFQVDLDVAQRTEVYDAGLKLAAHKVGVTAAGKSAGRGSENRVVSRESRETYELMAQSGSEQEEEERATRRPKKSDFPHLTEVLILLYYCVH